MSFLNYEKHGVISKWNDIDKYLKFNIYSENPVCEFESTFNGEFSGICVHKNKDVTFNLTFQNRLGNIISNSYEFVEDYDTYAIDIDILDKYGNLISGNFISGSTFLSHKITEDQNSILFTGYEPNFGIRVKTLNGGATSNSEIYTYGNVLEIDTITVNDAYGIWYNEDPITNQFYYPQIKETSDSHLKQLTNGNDYYFSLLNLNLDGYQLTVDAQVSFGKLDREKLLIDWGDGKTNVIFSQTGNNNTDFSGAGVLRKNVSTNDVLFTSEEQPYIINGNQYSFRTGHLYSGSFPNDVNINLYYSGINSTGYEIMESFFYSVPRQLKSEGFLLSSDTKTTGSIKIDFSFLNSMLYTDFDRVDIYKIQSLPNEFFDLYSGTNRFPTFSMVGNEFAGSIKLVKDNTTPSFLLNNEVNTKGSFYFKCVPYSTIGSGYAWHIGPYEMEIQEISQPTSLTSKLTFAGSRGNSSMEMINGDIAASGISIIDTLTRSDPYSLYTYDISVYNSDNDFASTRITIVDNLSGTNPNKTGVSFSESNISDFNYADFDYYYDDTYIYLTSELNYSSIYEGAPNEFGASYKMIKTSI